MKNEIVLFESSDNAVKLEVAVNQETVWLTQSQMTLLFNVDRTVITRHIGNIFREGELEQESNVQSCTLQMLTVPPSSTTLTSSSPLAIE